MDLRATAEQQFANKPRWRKPKDQSVLPANPKQALLELKMQLKTLADVPESWGECIRKRHATVIEMRPRLPRSEISGWRPLRPPRIAAVPLACGALRGETMSVGVRLESKNLADVGEAFLLSSETLSYRHGQALVTAILFSPVSGRVFIRFPTSPEGLATQCMPALTAASDATALKSSEPDCVEAFVFVKSRQYLLWSTPVPACGQWGRCCGMVWGAAGFLPTAVGGVVPFTEFSDGRAATASPSIHHVGNGVASQLGSTAFTFARVQWCLVPAPVVNRLAGFCECGLDFVSVACMFSSKHVFDLGCRGVLGSRSGGQHFTPHTAVQRKCMCTF